MTVTVIGCDGSALAPAAAAAPWRARPWSRVRRRHLAAVSVPPAAERIVIQHLDTALDAICAARGPAAVLASGDPGFFGIVRALRARGVTPVVIPAVSSVALAFARLGLDWADALVLSAHGRDLRPVLAAALAHPKAAILTGPPEAATGQLRSQLLAAGRTVYVAERLGTPDEQVHDLTQDPAAEVSGPARAHRPRPRRRPQPGPVAGRAPGRPAGLGAARDRLRAPRLHDHQGRSPGAGAGPARPRPGPDGLGRRRRVRFGRGGVRPVRRVGRRGRFRRARSAPASAATPPRTVCCCRSWPAGPPRACADLPAPDAVFAGGGDDDAPGRGGESGAAGPRRRDARVGGPGARRVRAADRDSATRLAAPSCRPPGWPGCRADRSGSPRPTRCSSSGRTSPAPPARSGRGPPRRDGTGS